MYRGGLLSAVGALALGLGLLMLGQPVLAATAGLLHAAGKAGSAWGGGAKQMLFWPESWPDLWRTLVLASRVPGVLAASTGLLDHLNGLAGSASGLSVLTPAALTLSYLLWIKADVILFKASA